MGYSAEARILAVSQTIVSGFGGWQIDKSGTQVKKYP